MIAILSRLFSNLIVGLCLFSGMLFFFSMAASLRLLPRTLGLVRQALRGFLRFSFQGYATILSWLRPTLMQEFGVDVMNTLPRVIVTTSLSLVIGVSLYLLTNLAWSWVVVAVTVLHGLFVGLAWEGIMHEEDFRMGASIE